MAYKTTKRFPARRLIDLLRRNRKMLGRLSENPDRLNDLSEAELDEMIDLKQRTNEELEKQGETGNGI